jgi:tRNA threonylcarbamoyl adenosine modification protein YeaZ
MKLSGEYPMKILALEFSSPQRSVALLTPNAHISEVVETGFDANAPLPMIEEALGEAKLEREQIECLAVGIGPGSYTGIRSAIALAQGWQLAREVKLLGVSSVECIAAQAQAENIQDRVSVVVDAQREEFYLAVYEIAGNDLREVEPLRIVPMLEMRKREQAGDLLIGPEVTRWFPGGRIIFPRAATLANLASKRNNFIPGEKLEPIYLRETKFIKAPPPRVF